MGNDRSSWSFFSFLPLFIHPTQKYNPLQPLLNTSTLIVSYLSAACSIKPTSGFGSSYTSSSCLSVLVRILSPLYYYKAGRVSNYISICWRQGIVLPLERSTKRYNALTSSLYGAMLSCLPCSPVPPLVECHSISPSHRYRSNPPASQPVLLRV